ncbi:CAMKK protein kinase [Trichophyton interdigitale MR816]|uniref:non-specific serine/threonine protein kinase n=1 Tax=Trichophyton interdigitale (strain MR816) TaxID=1215338 RepID=A0A059JIF2_TRIIM|nr:CAMKK protein kinase [Trichophyton interdigitale MR816]
MDSRSRNAKKTPEEGDDRGRIRSSRSRNIRHDRRDQDPETGDGESSKLSWMSAGLLSRQTSNTLARQMSIPNDSRPEERRTLAQKLHLFPYRPHSSNTSRDSSTNTSSSSLPSLVDPAAGCEAGPPSSSIPASSASTVSDPISQSVTTPRQTAETGNVPPLSPLAELPMVAPRATIRGPSHDLPVYPNQSYAMLQQQIHPAPYRSPTLRTRSSYPSHSDFAFPQPTTPWARESNASPNSRTVGNTPISSPGLFSARTPRTSPSIGSEDGQAGAHLHRTHMQEPKETHTVEVDRHELTGNKLINEYEILEELGRGEHGKVKLGRHLKTAQSVAIKIVQRYSKRRRLGKLGNPEDKVKKEVAILKKARHPNVVSLLEVIDDPNQQKVYIVLEYIENGEIVWRKKGLKEIVLVDKQRLDREKRGIPDSLSFIENSQQFIHNTQLRRRHIEALRQRQRAKGAQHIGVSGWSLEHGGESDNELDTDYPPMSKFPTASSAHSHDTPEFQISPQHSLTSTGEFDRRMREMAGFGSDNGLYGGYASDPMFARRYSNASSHLAFQTESDWLSDDDDTGYVPCLTLSEARTAFRDAVLGLEYLHYQGIIHRDIKPANLLVTGNHRVKISDFGVSYLGRPIRDEDEEQVTETDATELDDARELSKTVGTPAFYAPELCYTGVECEPTVGKDPKITGAIDVWALGVTLYGMIYGRLPFVADDEFSLFQNIVRHDVFIPTKRLKAVVADDPVSDHHPHSHSHTYSHSHTQRSSSVSSSTRSEGELAYEAVDEDLRDLLRRLLIKNPSKRITLKEIKHHPWITRDIQDPKAWIEDTDPGYQSKGKKIEVSNDDVIRAVTKMPFIERVRSNVVKWSGSIFGRRRAPSSATSVDTAPSVSSGSSLTIGKDIIRELRRTSLRGDEEITRTPRAGREGEHPLSQSLVVSPDLQTDIKHPDYFGRVATSRTAPTSVNCSPVQEPRPDLPGRTVSKLSSAGSTKTIRPANLEMSFLNDPSNSASGNDSFSSSPGGMTIFGGARNRLVKGLHLRDRRNDSCESPERGSFDAACHSTPSVAISSASATGLVNPPDLAHESNTTPTPHASPRRYTIHRRSKSHQLRQDANLAGPPPAPLHRDFLFRNPDSTSHHNLGQDNATIVNADKDDFHIHTSPVHYLNTLEPESYEDDPFKYQPIARPITSPPSAITMSSSSMDDYNSEMSHCASHPSIPSVVSGASSLSADGLSAYPVDLQYEKKSEKEHGTCTCPVVPPMLRTGDTVTDDSTRTATDDNKRPEPVEMQSNDDDQRYHGDDEDEDDDSSDEGITFGRRKSSV